MTDKVCYECKHLVVSEEEEGYSEYTPGASAYIACMENHWSIDLCYGANDYSKGGPTVRLRDGLHMAQTCPDFEPVDT